MAKKNIRECVGLKKPKNATDLGRLFGMVHDIKKDRNNTIVDNQDLVNL